MLTVSCPGCSARYRLTDEQVAGRNRVKLRCTRCQRVFEAEIPTAAATAGFNPPTASPTNAPARSSAPRPSSGGQADGISGFENLFDEKAGLSALSKEEEVPSMSFAGDLFDNPLGGDVAPAKLTTAMAPISGPAPGADVPRRAAPSSGAAPAAGRRGDDFPRLNPGPSAAAPAPAPAYVPPPTAMLPRGTQLDAPSRDNLGNFDFGDEPAPSPAGGLDPMVEFHDVFREAKGGDAEQARRYSKSDMFAAAGGGPINLTSTGAGVAREGDAPRPTSRLPSLDQGLAAGRRPGIDAPDDDIVQKALASSTARETLATRVNSDTSGGGGITPVDLTGERTGAGIERLDPGPRLIGTMLALVTAFVVAAGWVAYKNDGVLDLRDPAGAIEVALGGAPVVDDAPAEPRRVATVVEGSGGEAPLPTIGTLAVSRYVTEAGVSFVVVDGDVVIPSGSTYRRLDVDVVARVAGRDGETRRARVGAVLDSLALERSSEGTELDERHEAAVAAVAEVTFARGQPATFRAVFDARDIPDGTEFVARLASANRAVEAACWSDVSWRDAEGSAHPAVE